jgi:ABC-type multidrug transport system fused ATPase/permease subunit
MVEQGTHDELIAREDGVYRQLHDIQFQETPEAVATASA